VTVGDRIESGLGKGGECLRPPGRHCQVRPDDGCSGTGCLKGVRQCSGGGDPAHLAHAFDEVVCLVDGDETVNTLAHQPVSAEPVTDVEQFGLAPCPQRYRHGEWNGPAGQGSGLDQAALVRTQPGDLLGDRPFAHHPPRSVRSH